MSQTVNNNNDTSLITVEELFGVVYDELNNLVHYLAIRYSSETEILMSKDEIVSELYMELWKGCSHYYEKGLPKEQMIAVLKVMLSNRVAELRYRYYKTHRKISQLNISIDVYIQGEYNDQDNSWNEERLDGYDITQALVPNDTLDPSVLFDSSENVNNIRMLLDKVAREVFDAVVYGHKQLTLHVWLSAVRANAVYKTSREVKIKPFHIASALCLPETDVKMAIGSIRNAMHEVYEYEN